MSYWGINMAQRLLTIYPIQSCNLRCVQCPATEGQIPINHPWNKLNFEMLKPWMIEYFPAHKTVVEVRGGEPSLAWWLEKWLAWMESVGYNGLIKTNGIVHIPKTKGFIRICAWHRDISFVPDPNNYDWILILQNPQQDWLAKVKYCEENGIPYKLGEYQIFHGKDKGKIYGKLQGKPVSFFKSWTLVYSNGDINQCTMCKKYNVEGDLDLHPDDRGAKVWKMSPPKFRKPCPLCSNVVGQELWIDRDWRRYLKNREREVEMQIYNASQNAFS